MKFPSGQTALSFAVRFGGVFFGLSSGALLARLLQPEKYGAYAFALAVVTICALPITVGLRQTVVRETAYAESHGNSDQRMALWLWAGGMALRMGAALAVLLALAALVLVRDPEHQSHLLIGALVLLLMPLPQLSGGALQGMGRVIQAQIPEYVIRQGVLLAGAALLWQMDLSEGPSTAMALVLFALALIVAGGAGFAMLARATRFSLAAARRGAAALDRKALMRAVVSFAAIGGLQQLMANLDIFMLGLLSTGTETGLYRTAVIMSGLVSFGLLVINSVIVPRVASLHAQADDRALQDLVTQAARRITLFAACGAVGLIVLGPWILETVFSEAYLPAAGPLRVLVLAQFVNAFFGPNAMILNMTGNEGLTFRAGLFALFLNAVLNFILISQFGVMGAAWATAITLFVLNFAMAVALYRNTGFNSTMLRWG